jgi:VCBS repeat-containing protein
VHSVRKIVPIFFGILILTSSAGFQFAPITVQTAEAEPSKRIVGYFPWWESGDIDFIDYSKVTDIIYFHIWPNSDGSLDTTDINYNINNLHTIRDRAHAAGVNVLISAGGWGVSDGFPAMAADPTSRANFVTNIENFLTTHDLDGIDIDWEPIDTEIKKDNFALLLSDLAASLQPDGKLVTVAVNAERVELRASTANSLSWANIMAYDMNWNNAEHSTFIDAIAALDRYESNGIPKEKLVLGVPFYGRSSGWSSDMKYEDIVSSCAPTPDQNYCNGHYFNGIDLVQQKAQYVLDGGYSGVMIWNLGQDTYDQTSLLNAINEVLDGSPLPDMPPVAINDSYVVEAEITLDIASPGVLSNDSDPNNDSLTVLIDSDVSNGVLTLNANGSFSYSPNSAFEGVDSFTYHANDGTNNSNIVTVTITVNPTNNVHLENLEITNSGNKRWTGVVTITVFGEIDNSVSEVTVLGTWSGGSSGTASCVTDSAGQCKVSKSTKGDNLTFTVDNISGSDVTYDSSLNNVDTSITINKDGTIPGQNTPPSANSGGPYTGITNTIMVFDGSGSTDPDGDSLTYLWNFGDGNIGSVVNPSHAYTSDGTYNVTLEVTDSEGATDINSTTVLISSQGNTNLTITQIFPNSMIKGQTITTTIFGTGFELGANVKFGGAKWVPTAISTTIIDPQTIKIDVTRGTAGPNKDFVYDVSVTNSNGDSFTLPDSFTVTSK